MAIEKKWYERINWMALAVIGAAMGALYFGAKHGMSVDQIVAAASGVAILAAQFHKLIDTRPSMRPPPPPPPPPPSSGAL